MAKDTDGVVSTSRTSVTRRRFMAYFSGIGLTTTLLPGVLWAKMQQRGEARITKSMLANAEKLAGLVII